jgi:hypothetical protein
LDFDPLNFRSLGPLNGLANNPTEGYPSLKLLNNIFSDEGSVGVNAVNFDNVDADLALIAKDILETRSEGFDARTTTANDNTGPGSVNL